MALTCFIRSLKLFPAGGSVLGIKFRGCNTAAIATSLSYIATKLPRDSLSSYVYKSQGAGTLSVFYCSTRLGH